MALDGTSKVAKKLTAKKRKERFTDSESHKLVDTILEHSEQLFGSKALKASDKKAIWEKVVNEVNKVGDKKRTTAECRKKWQDYKRKVSQCIDDLKKQSSAGGQMVPLSDVLSSQQIKVSELFKMDSSDGQKIEEHDESSLDNGECVSTNEHVLAPSCIIDSEDESDPSHEKSFSCLPSTSHQDKVISQSCEEPQTPSVPCDSHNTKAVDKSIPPHTTTESQLQLLTQIDQPVAEQNNIFEVLQSIQKNITASQNKMYKCMMKSFQELQKTLLTTQKASNDRSSILEFRLNGLHTKLDEMNSALQVKQLQENMSSDESELSVSGTQDKTSNSTTTAHTLKNNTPDRKRALDQSTSITKLLKKKKQI